jgi:uncharacterized protein (UPF0261 family)
LQKRWVTQQILLAKLYHFDRDSRAGWKQPYLEPWLGKRMWSAHSIPKELRYVRNLIAQAGIAAVLVDVGPRSRDPDCDVRSEEVAVYHPKGPAAVQSGWSRQSKRCQKHFRDFFLASLMSAASSVWAVPAAQRIAPALQALPIGLPKILVSTLASGDVAAYVGTSDIQMINPVTDLAGLNRASRVVLGNASHALVGMVERPVQPATATKAAIGLTMYGVTTPCVRQATDRLNDRFECLVFHATGPGGRSMEHLLESGLLTGVVDVTSSDIVDLLLGGDFAATQDRLGAVARTRAPYVGSCGGLDMINFRTPEAVPKPYRGRTLHRHNQFITLVRTLPEDGVTVGRWIEIRLSHRRTTKNIFRPTPCRSSTSSSSAGWILRVASWAKAVAKFWMTFSANGSSDIRRPEAKKGSR